MSLRSGGGSRFLLKIGRFRFFPADADELGDSGLLHSDSIEHAAHLHGLTVVRNDDELRLAAHLADQAGEAADVGLIERGVDFVKDTERAGLVAEDSDE